MPTTRRLPSSLRGRFLRTDEDADREPADPPARYVTRETVDDNDGGDTGEDSAYNSVLSKTPDNTVSKNHPETHPPEDGTHRVVPANFDYGLVCPPSVTPATDKLLRCGCDGDCGSELLSENVPNPADECPNPVPVTRATAREVYTKIENGTRDGDREHGEFVDKACRQAAHLLDGDRYLQATYEGLSTALLSLRLSPTDEEGRVVTGYQLTEDLFAGMDSIMSALKYQLDKYGWDYQWVRVTSGTEHWSSPHAHILVYADDPENALYSEIFRRPIDHHVGKCPRASEKHHGVTDDEPGSGAVRVETNPPIATDIGGRDNVDSGHLRTVAPTRAGAYLANQLPHWACVGQAEPWEVDRAVTSWSSPRQWFRPSNGFPDREEVESTK